MCHWDTPLVTRRAVDGQEETLTRRQYYKIIGKQTEDITLAFQFRHYVDWFWELSSFRDPADGGICPIKPGLLRDWQGEFGVLLTYADKRIITAIDRAYINAMRKQREEVMRRKSAK